MSAKVLARRSKARGQPDRERLDATPERLARAAEAGQGSERGADRLRRMLDPFDVMRSTRALAPHDPRLNDVRWLIGEALRRLHQRAQLDALRAVALETVGSKAFGPRSGLPASEAALYARDKLRAAEERAGEAAWPIVARIVIEGGGVRDCRAYVPEIVTPWRADAIVADRLRVALDRFGDLLGVTVRRR
ncbi:MAG: hypothetical protein ACLPSW_07170 [Roseiarcus sp.]